MRVNAIAALFTLGLATCLGIAPGTAHAQVVEFRSVIDFFQAGIIGELNERHCLGYIEGPCATGSGVGSFSFNPETQDLDYLISFSGLSSPEVAAHIHGPAQAGQEAGVVYSLPAGSPKEGTFALVDLDAGTYSVEEQVADLRAELWYINIQSSDFPAGEIRGQIELVPEPSGGLLSAAALLALAVLRRRCGRRARRGGLSSMRRSRGNTR